MAHIECKGAHVTAEENCILQFFVKKPRGRAAATSTRQYDFSVILDVNLIIKSSFFDAVSAHRDQAIQASEGGVTKVCNHSNHDCSVSHGVAG